MKNAYTIILGKHPPKAYEEDWPHLDNRSTSYTVLGELEFLRLAEKIIDNTPAPWWWIFKGKGIELREEDLILSGAIDPDDMETIEGNLF